MQVLRVFNESAQVLVHQFNQPLVNFSHLNPGLQSVEIVKDLSDSFLAHIVVPLQNFGHFLAGTGIEVLCCYSLRGPSLATWLIEQIE